MITPALLTVKEAAATLRCSSRQIFKLISSGRIARAERFGRETVVLAESVFALCEAAYHPTAAKRVRAPKRIQVAEFDALLAEVRARS